VVSGKTTLMKNIIALITLLAFAPAIFAQGPPPPPIYVTCTGHTAGSSDFGNVSYVEDNYGGDLTATMHQAIHYPNDIRADLAGLSRGQGTFHYAALTYGSYAHMTVHVSETGYSSSTTFYKAQSGLSGSDFLNADATCTLSGTYSSVTASPNALYDDNQFDEAYNTHSYTITVDFVPIAGTGTEVAVFDINTPQCLTEASGYCHLIYNPATPSATVQMEAWGQAAWSCGFTVTGS